MYWEPLCLDGVYNGSKRTEPKALSLVTSAATAELLLMFIPLLKTWSTLRTKSAGPREMSHVFYILIVLVDLIAVAAVPAATVRVHDVLEPSDDVKHLEEHREGGDEDRQHKLSEDRLVGHEARLQPFDPA